MTAITAVTSTVFSVENTPFLGFVRRFRSNGLSNKTKTNTIVRLLHTSVFGLSPRKSNIIMTTHKGNSTPGVWYNMM